MKITQLSRRLLPALTFACAMGVAPLAMAQTAAAPAGTMAPMAASAGTMAASAAKPVAGKLTKAEKFKTEAAAQASCPADTVVWSSMTKSKVLHTSHSKYFGKTKHGVFVCEKTAQAAGYHLAKN